MSVVHAAMMLGDAGVWTLYVVADLACAYCLWRIAALHDLWLARKEGTVSRPELVGRISPLAVAIMYASPVVSCVWGLSPIRYLLYSSDICSTPTPCLRVWATQPSCSTTSQSCWPCGRLFKVHIACSQLVFVLGCSGAHRSLLHASTRERDSKLRGSGFRIVSIHVPSPLAGPGSSASCTEQGVLC